MNYDNIFHKNWITFSLSLSLNNIKVIAMLFNIFLFFLELSTGPSQGSKKEPRSNRRSINSIYRYVGKSSIFIIKWYKTIEYQKKLRIFQQYLIIYFCLAFGFRLEQGWKITAVGDGKVSVICYLKTIPYSLLPFLNGYMTWT